MDLELAGIAGAGIDLADGKAAAELLPRNAAEIGRELGKGCFIRRRRRLCQAPAGHILEEKSAHA
jgi:hypothetical protein